MEDEAEWLVALSVGEKIKMTDLARQAGFSNHSSFYRAVRAIRGGTPEVFGEKRYEKRQLKALCNGYHCDALKTI